MCVKQFTVFMFKFMKKIAGLVLCVEQWSCTAKQVNVSWGQCYSVKYVTVYYQ